MTRQFLMSEVPLHNALGRNRTHDKDSPELNWALEGSPQLVNGCKGGTQQEGHVRRRVLDQYGRVHKFVLGTSYMYKKSEFQRCSETRGASARVPQSALRCRYASESPWTLNPLHIHKSKNAVLRFQAAHIEFDLDRLPTTQDPKHPTSNVS